MNETIITVNFDMCFAGIFEFVMKYNTILSNIIICIFLTLVSGLNDTTTLMKRRLTQLTNNRTYKRSRRLGSDDTSDDSDNILHELGTEIIESIMGKKGSGGRSADHGKSHEDRNKLVYSVENRIYFRDYVSGKSVDKLISIINELNQSFRELTEDPMIECVKAKPIYLHIDSFGGCLFSAFKAVDAITRSKIPIYTVVDGVAASCGTMMSVVGKKRYITPHSHMLIHQLSDSASGTYRELQDAIEADSEMMEQIKALYKKHTKMTKKEINKYLGHDLWWGSTTCLKFGLADELYEENA